MRADAARNLDAVLQTGARLLADDPSTSMAAIASEAGVDRRTVYRRFDCRDSLLRAVLEAKLDAIETVFADARLQEAPVAVAFHRFVEGVIAVVRRYPIDHEQISCDAELHARARAQRERLRAFMTRAVQEGVVRDGLPDGIPVAMLYATVTLLAHRYPDLDPGRAADLAVDILLSGIGRG